MQNKFSWLALGDSYTIGESVNANQRFPAQTISLLRNDDLDFSEPVYIATTGWTTQNLLDAISNQNLQGRYDIVSLLIGVNDQYQQIDLAGYRIRFGECLKKAIALAGNDISHVFILSIPDYSVTPFASDRNVERIRDEIDEFNVINKEISLAYRVSYTNITTLSREAKNDPTLTANDGLHPSAKEYAKWATLLSNKIKNALR